MKRFLLTAAALMAGSATLAQTPPPAPTATMAHPMHDKVTTRAEAVGKVREHFARLDGNRDGVITTEEVTESHARLAEKFKDFEGRGPHVMRLEREPRDPNAAFDRLDANKDGSISRDEFAKAREERIERRIVLRDGKEGEAQGHGEHGDVLIHRMDGSPSDGKDVRRHVRRMHGPGGFGGRMIVMADTDKDGRTTLAEAEALALQHFDQMDTNRDGQVTPEERRAARPMIIKQMVEQKKKAS